MSVDMRRVYQSGRIKGVGLVIRDEVVEKLEEEEAEARKAADAQEKRFDIGVDGITRSVARVQIAGHDRGFLSSDLSSGLLRRHFV